MNQFRRIVDGLGIAWQTSSDPDQAGVKPIPILLAFMTVAAGAIIILAFQRWVDFDITDLSGTEAEAATGISDGWVVIGLASVVLLIGGILFRPQMSPLLLPAIAVASVCILGIAGFDTVTNWEASGVHPEDPGIFVQSPGDPTVVPYAISALAILIAVLAAVVRGIQLRESQRLREAEADREVIPARDVIPAEDENRGFGLALVQRVSRAPARVINRHPGRLSAVGTTRCVAVLRWPDRVIIRRTRSIGGALP